MPAAETPESAPPVPVESISTGAIRDSFGTLVRSLGDDPERLLRQEGLEPRQLSLINGSIPLRGMIDLLEHSSRELDCPDFGLKLANVTLDSVSVVGPLAVAMRNAETVGDAFRFCERHMHVYTPAVEIRMRRSERDGRDYMQWEVSLDDVGDMQQTVEHALMLSYNSARTLSGGRAHPQEIWFRHEPVSDRYAHYLPVPVRFGMPFNALFFGNGDLDQPIQQRDGMIYEMACAYIEQHFPVSCMLLTRRMRALLGQLLERGHCTQTQVAELLGIGARTLQRRLRNEGTTFEAIVDCVRRDIALRCLGDPQLSMLQIIERLGYSETSVLTRSCHRWFGCAPLQLRRLLTIRG